MTHIYSDLITVLKRAAAFLVFKNPSNTAARSAPGLPAVALLVAMTFLLTVGFESYQGETELTFNAYGISAWLAGWALVISGLILCGTRGDVQSLAGIVADLCIATLIFSGLFIALLIISPGMPQGAIGFGLSVQDGVETAGSIIIFVWAIAVTVFIGRVHWKGTRWLPGLKLLFVALLPTLFVPHQPMVYGTKTDWTRYDVWEIWKGYKSVEKAFDEVTSTDNNTPLFDYEAAIYRQQSLVARVLSGIKPSTEAGPPNIFFVAAAPYASQDVFKREVLATKDLFDNRFGTANRSALLINHRDTAVTLPMANATNLELMLNGIAKVMNVRRDILVLFLTTHGSKGKLSVSFPGFTFNDITPDMLANALDHSHIRNRVLIISACHSGSFLPRLTNEDTIILAAAHADKTSFGCSNERDWTYFGDALLNRALRNTYALDTAFEQAKAHIKQWETKEKLTPSEPQIFVGERIRHKWNRIAKRLRVDHKRSKPARLSQQAEPNLRDTNLRNPGAIIQQPAFSTATSEKAPQTTF